LLLFLGGLTNPASGAAGEGGYSAQGPIIRRPYYGPSSLHKRKTHGDLTVDVIADPEGRILFIH